MVKNIAIGILVLLTLYLSDCLHTHMQLNEGLLECMSNMYELLEKDESNNELVQKLLQIEKDIPLFLEN